MTETSSGETPAGVGREAAPEPEPDATNARYGPLHPVRFTKNRPLQALVAAYAVVWTWSAIGPKYPRDWLLENLLVFAFVALLAATYRRFQFSNVSYGLFALFLALHAYGAHSTYAETPFGFWLKEHLGLDRNPYDRIVHFAFGLLLTYPMRELGLRRMHLRGLYSWSVPFLVILALSADYELVESWVARIVSPELGDAYLGTQGDIWDAHKDMALAMLGAIIAMGVTAAVNYKCQRDFARDWSESWKVRAENRDFLA